MAAADNGAGQPAPTTDDRGRASAGRVGPRGGRSNDGKSGSGSVDPNNQGNGLHKPPVAGEHADMPGVKPWKYSGDSQNEGSGKYAKDRPTLADHMMHEAATIAAEKMKKVWPDASKNLLHFLGNTGDPQPIDVDAMIRDMPHLKQDSEFKTEEYAHEAVEDAAQRGVTGPVTYSFDSSWRPGGADQSTQPNWFYATGNFQAATDGTITVYPPKDGSSNWTYKYNYQTHVADRYNWDGSKSTTIFGITITDKQLQRLHQTGLAQEYDLSGESSVSSGSGTVEVK